jgi:lipoyl(octanoyl) transferase
MAAVLPAPSVRALQMRRPGRVDYRRAWDAMRSFSAARGADTPDELWCVEHPPVYTMGLKGAGGAVREIGGVPLVYTDRGGDLTYHGPGQAVLYCLLDLRRLGLGIKGLVRTLEQTVIDYLAVHGVAGERRAGAPGVYVAGRKIAALGLRVRGACCYHGLALNVDMDLAPFTRIDPCGCRGLEVTQLAALGVRTSVADVHTAVAAGLADRFGYNAPVEMERPALPEEQHG